MVSRENLQTPVEVAETLFRQGRVELPGGTMVTASRRRMPSLSWIGIGRRRTSFPYRIEGTEGGSRLRKGRQTFASEGINPVSAFTGLHHRLRVQIGNSLRR